MVTAIEPQEVLSPTERTQLEQAEQQIQSGLQTFLTIGNQLLIIQQNKLYREDYATFEDYMVQRWNIKSSTGYDYIAGFKLSENLQISTPAEDIQLKPSFTRLLQSYDAATQVKLYNNALILARRENNEITARHIKESIILWQTELDKKAVYASKYSPIIQKMNNNEITPAKAVELCDTLSSLKPSVRGDMLIRQVTDPALMRLMDKKHKTNTYHEAIASGHISVWYDDLQDYHQLPLSQCNAHHFQQALNESYDNRLQERLTQNATEQGITIKSCLIHFGDPDETIKELINAGASQDHLQQLATAITKYIAQMDKDRRDA